MVGWAAGAGVTGEAETVTAGTEMIEKNREKLQHLGFSDPF